MKKQLLALAGILTLAQLTPTWAFPQYAATYDQAREPSGRISCANCHLAHAEVEPELPQAVLPGKVFEVEVKIPYDVKAQQVVAAPNEQGEYKATMQAGAYLQLPKGFRLANPEEMTPEQKEKIDSGEWPAAAPLYDGDENPEKAKKTNVVIVGPIDTETMTKLNNVVTIPVMAPDPNVDENAHFGKYSVYIGANRGRGQVYPDGTVSNNAEYLAPVGGTITKIAKDVPLEMGDQSYEKGGTILTIKSEKGDVEVKIPPGPELLAAITEGATIETGKPLTGNPNIGGFGHTEVDIVLQDPQRVIWLLVALGIAFSGQLLLVLKKKQIEKIQEYEAHQQGLL